MLQVLNHSRNALFSHCLHQDGNGRGHGLEGLQCVGGPRHETVLALLGVWVEEGVGQGEGQVKREVGD